MAAPFYERISDEVLASVGLKPTLKVPCPPPPTPRVLHPVNVTPPDLSWVEDPQLRGLLLELYAGEQAALGILSDYIKEH